MRKIKNKKLETILSTLVEFTEFTIITLIAVYLLKVPIKNVIVILLVFFISRFRIGSAGHYKIVNYFDGGWRRCFFWTTSLILSLSLSTRLGLLVGILFTIFTVFIISGKANIDDLSEGWKVKREEGKYYDIEEYVKYHEYDDELMEFEDKVEKRDNKLYLIYKYRFKDHKTFDQISELLNIPTNRITEQLDKIAFSLRIYCKI